LKVSLEHEPIRQRRGQRIIRPKEAWTRLGIGHSNFYQNFVAIGRIRLIPLDPRGQGVFEHELEALMDELAAERDRPTTERSLPLCNATPPSRDLAVETPRHPNPQRQPQQPNSTAAG
jgi:hypothetical protein